MTNEDIVSNEPSLEFVGYSHETVIRLMNLARADELRKVAEDLNKCVSDEALIIALSLKKDADELEREARA